jgi:catechol 2,3-dioxygenase-like lactoylglutathione lyase family enzyme
VGDIVGHPGVVLEVATLRLPGSDLGLELIECLGPDRESVDTDDANPGMSHLAFIVDDLLAVHAEWTAAGVASVGPPVTHTVGPNAGGMVVYMIDPDGFRVELIQRP